MVIDHCLALAVGDLEGSPQEEQSCMEGEVSINTQLTSSSIVVQNVNRKGKVTDLLIDRRLTGNYQKGKDNRVS